MAELWTIKGRIVVDHLLPELIEMNGSRSGLGGITVKVSARSKILTAWGTWNAWDTVKTGPDGRFQVSNELGSDRRQFKVQILFDSDRLRIKEGGETHIGLDSTGFPIDIEIDLTDKDWYEIYSDKDADKERKAGLHDLGDLVVTGMPRKHGDIWTLYNAVLNLLASYGSNFTLDGKAVVKYPMSISPQASSSYWNPLNGHGYIKEDQFNTYTLLHEFTHRIEYEHCTGEMGMAWQLVKHGTTHQKRENTTYVPFLESFADFGAVKILQEISGGKIKNFLAAAPYSRPDHPFRRDHIGDNLSPDERNLANLDYTELGWYGLFSVLTFPWLDRIDVDRTFIDTEGEHPNYAFLSLFSALSDLKTGYSFKQLLSVFLKKPSASVNALLSTNEMNFGDFLNRAGKILPDLDADKIRGVKQLLNPVATAARTAAVGT
jgi:hypothetical protein